ncbi:flippase-like domain-containing protein [Mariprofundus sp. NF]|uniref:lysylphosphatidylglycerol synthase transmembrane domain-containing protein n=1 Tax=Mariprofundus sp. NF TaxID=2608716 RepID=UPI00159F9DA1|nr:lysylphosphatidylglycerol synthase transmembrane domain-containing protein [Mariprofundus sp. NF]NWF38798.1 flippase-like domain-containing protein [Mariprofundus sp. NF]
MIWIKLILSVILLGYLAWALDLGAILGLLKTADWSLVIAACLCLIIGQVFSAIRWAWLARGLGLTVSISKKVQLYFLGMFLSLFLPSIIGGDVARGWLLAKGKEKAGWLAAASVILERLNGVAGLAIVISFCMFFLEVPSLWIWLWNVGLLVGFIVIATTKLWWPKLQDSGRQGKLSGWKSLPLTSPEFATAWWRSIPVSLLFQALVVQSHVFLGLAVGLELSWFVYGFMVCLVALASALPLSFNGFGIREAGYVGIAVWFGASSEAAAAMASLWIVVLIIAAIPGGIVLWKLGGTKALKKDKA